MKKIFITSLFLFVTICFSGDVSAQGTGWETLGNDLYRNTNTGEIFHYDGTRQETSDGQPVFKTSAEADAFFQTGSDLQGSYRPLEPGDPGYTGPGYSDSNSNSSAGFSGTSNSGGSYNPGISSACSIRNIDSIATCAITIINTILYFLMSGALLYTVWAAFKLVKDGDSADGRSEARQQIIAGIVALAVMSSVWGLVAILTTTFGLSGSTPVAPPQIRIR